MSENDSRTTRKARTILPDAQVSVAIPAEALHTDGQPLENQAGKTFKALFNRTLSPPANPAAKVLAFTPAGTAVMDTKASNGGIPVALVAQTAAFPRVIEEDSDGLVVELTDVKYRVGRIYKATMLSAIDAAAASAEATGAQAPVDVSAGEGISEIDDQAEGHEAVSEDHLSDDETPVTSEEFDDEEHADEPVEELVVDAESPTTAPDTSPIAGAKASALSWTRSLEQALFDETPSAPIETRSRPTVQCQRLLRDQHVYLAVPGAAQPREGTDDPKGDVLVAFTDSGVMLFKPSRGNKALPRDVIGPIDSEPLDFEPADYSARDGGVLTVGGRRYIVPRAYVRSLMTYLEQERS